jgi:hypothetical protein
MRSMVQHAVAAMGKWHRRTRETRRALLQACLSVWFFVIALLPTPVLANRTFSSMPIPGAACPCPTGLPAGGGSGGGGAGGGGEGAGGMSPYAGTACPGGSCGGGGASGGGTGAGGGGDGGDCPCDGGCFLTDDSTDSISSGAMTPNPAYLAWGTAAESATDMGLSAAGMNWSMSRSYSSILDGSTDSNTQAVN